MQGGFTLVDGAEAAGAMSAAQFAAAFAAAGDGVCHYGPDDRIVGCNAAALAFRRRAVGFVVFGPAPVGDRWLTLRRRWPAATAG